MNSIAMRKQRWCDFLDMGILPERRSGHLFLIPFDPDAPARPHPWPDQKQARIEWAWQLYERQRQRMEWLHDDALPYLDPYTGTEIFAEAFGCSIQRPSDDMPFARPLISAASQVASVRVPDLSARPLADLFDIADELRRRAGPEALMKLVDIQSPMDIAALIWDKNTAYIALCETPEAMLELAAKVRELLMAFLDEWFRRYGTEFIAHYPAYYMPRGITLSEDEVGAVSREMFVQYYLPELAELSNRYGGIGMHCCAHARHQWDNFKRIPNLRLLNLVQPNPVLRQAWSFFADHVPQMHSWMGDGPAWTWPQQYPAGARMVIEAPAQTRDEALELCERLHVACGRT
jgi:hypothetical protein